MWKSFVLLVSTVFNSHTYSTSANIDVSVVDSVQFDVENGNALQEPLIKGIGEVQTTEIIGVPTSQ